MRYRFTRRHVLMAAGSTGAVALAGCTGSRDAPADDAMTEAMTDDGMAGEMTDDGMDDAMTDDGMMDGAMTDDGMMDGTTDPAAAPRASIDRFSEAAGTLMVRSMENDLPGPDEPVDFDRGPFVTRGLGPDGAPVSYYNFDVQPTQPAPIYAFVRASDGAPVEGQLNVIDAVPGDQGYNDFWHVHRVTVPDDYVANTVTSASDLMAGDYDVTATTVVKNCPVVPDGSTASRRYGGGDVDLVEGWYRDQVVSYFLFEEASLSVVDGRVPVSPIYVSFNTNPDEPGGGPPSGFLTESGSDQTHNVVATLPGDDGYSPLWLVTIYDNADFGMVADLESASHATVLAAGAATVNCPVVDAGM